MNKTYNFPCTRNASDVIRKQKEQAIYNPCKVCTLQKAFDNNNMLNNQSPLENQIIQYKNGMAQWVTISSDIQIISTTSGNVTSTIDTTSLNGIVFITPDAGSVTGRFFYLPVAPPIGFNITIKNTSSAAWNISTTETNALLYGPGTNTLTMGASGKIFFQYLGLVYTGGSYKPVWAA